MKTFFDNDELAFFFFKKQNKTKQNKTKQNKTKQNKTKQKQNKTCALIKGIHTLSDFFSFVKFKASNDII